MRSRTERTVLTAIAVVLVAAAAAAWWAADRCRPHAGPWAAQAWKKITRPGPHTLPAGKRAPPARPAPPPCRCLLSADFRCAAVLSCHIL